MLVATFGDDQTLLDLQKAITKSWSMKHVFCLFIISLSLTFILNNLVAQNSRESEIKEIGKS